MRTSSRPGKAATRPRTVLHGRALLQVVALLAATQVACAPNPACGTGDTCTRVLFIGNSYTSVNDLPATFANLAISGGHHVETTMLATGGATLADHVADPETVSTMQSTRWNVVVLQEQSEIPSVGQLRQTEMYPAARSLVTSARNSGGTPMFFLTWGHKNGWPPNGLAGFGAMQSALITGYQTIATEQHAPVIPVGMAWALVASRETDPGLWIDDGSHPTPKATYLAACVFFASIFHQSPVGLGFHGGLADEEAARLQKAASDTVLVDPARWGLG